MIHAAALDVWWHDIDTLSAEHPQLSWMVGEITFLGAILYAKPNLYLDRLGTIIANLEGKRAKSAGRQRYRARRLAQRAPFQPAAGGHHDAASRAED